MKVPQGSREVRNPVFLPHMQTAAFLAADLLTTTRAGGLLFLSETRMGLSQKRPRASLLSSQAAEREDASAELGRTLCESAGGGPMFFPVHSWPDSLCSSTTFMRLWNGPWLSFPVNDFISSLGCRLGRGLVYIYSHYEQWKSAPPARLAAPTVKPFLSPCAYLQILELRLMIHLLFLGK